MGYLGRKKRSWFINCTLTGYFHIDIATCRGTILSIEAKTVVVTIEIGRDGGALRVTKFTSRASQLHGQMSIHYPGFQQLVVQFFSSTFYYFPLSPFDIQ